MRGSYNCPHTQFRRVIAFRLAFPSRKSTRVLQIDAYLAADTIFIDAVMLYLRIMSVMYFFMILLNLPNR